jgi:uncharacterized protein
MSSSYKTPGVYVQEVSTLPASIAAVPTAIPGIVGYTEKAALADGTDVVGKPVRITSMLEFEQIFGGPFKQEFNVNVSGTIAAPSIAVTPKFGTDPELAPYILYYQMQMFYSNGGGTCYVVSAGDYTLDPPLDKADLNAGLSELEKIDEITLVNIPEIVKFTLPADRKELNDAMLAHSAKMENRFALLDVLQGGTVFADASDFRDDEVGIDNLKFGASYYPGLITTQQHFYLDAGVKITTTVPEWADYDDETLEVVKNGGTSDPPVPAEFPPNTTLYNLVTAELKKASVELYPSSSMAGVYARVDDTRGVWKAPANVGLRSVKAPSVLITDAEQGDLNIDSASGKSINAIRNFEGRGLLVWGARTLDGNSNEWRYVNVRRLFLFVEQSTKNASQFVVFEPNSAITWNRVKGMISNFLTNLWRDGGLVGATAEEAFFVRVGIGETMTTQDVLEGRMIVDIGLAASRPAEFIVLRFSHFISQE